MKCMNVIRTLVAVGLVWPSLVYAQSSPNFTYGQVPTAGQWNALFAGKQDTLGFVPLNQAGGTLTGKLTTAVPNSSSAGFNLPLGTGPLAPKDGDLWTTNTGLYVQINGATVGPIRNGNVAGPSTSVVGNIATFGNVSGSSIVDSGKSLPSGAIVGTTDTQTLTNKTLVAAVISSPAISSPALTGTITVGGVTQVFPTSGLLVGTTDPQTLAGKTLISPALGDATGSSLTLTPTSPLGTALVTNQTLSGTSTGNISANYFGITDDAATSLQGIMTGWNYNIAAGGGTLQGNHFGVNTAFRFTAPDNGMTVSPNFVTLGPSMTITSGDGGTGTTASTSRGAFFVSNPVIHASNSPNLFEVTGSEIDVACTATCSTYYKSALSLVELGDDATQGSEIDALLVLSANPGAVGMKNVIDISGANGAYPYNSASTLIRAGSGGTARNLIDGSATTITGSLLKGKYANLTENTLTLGDNAGNTYIAATGGPSAASSLILRPGGANSLVFQNANSGTAFARFDQGGGSPANYPVLSATGSGAGNAIYGVDGSDTNINLNLTPKGTGVVNVAGSALVSSNLSVTGTMNSTGGYKSGASVGVSCAAGTVNLSTMVVTNGIVTHC